MKYSFTLVSLALLASTAVALPTAEAVKDRYGNDVMPGWNSGKAQQLGNTMHDWVREQRAEGGTGKDMKKLDRKLTSAGYPGLHPKTKTNRRSLYARDAEVDADAEAEADAWADAEAEAYAEAEAVKDRFGNDVMPGWNAGKAQQLGNTMHDWVREQRAEGGTGKDMKKLDRKLTSAGYPGLHPKTRTNRRALVVRDAEAYPEAEAEAWAEAEAEAEAEADAEAEAEAVKDRFGNDVMPGWNAGKAQQLGNTMHDWVREQRAEGGTGKDMKKLDRKLTSAGYPGLHPKVKSSN